MALAERNDDAPRAAGTSSNAEVLAECRDLVLDRLCGAIAASIEDIEADLLGRFDAAISSDQVKLYTEAQRQLALVKSDIDRQFRSTFQRSFQQKSEVPRHDSGVYGADDGTVLELALVAREEVADEVTVRNLANRMGGACEAELAELKPRLAHLFGRPEVPAENDPFAPEAVCQVLKEVCWKMDSPRSVRTLLLEQFANRLAAEMAALYREINRHLVSRRVLPRVRHVFRRNRPTGMSGSRVSAAGETVGGANGPGPENADNDLLGVLRQLLAAGDTPRGTGGTRAQGLDAASGASGELIGLLDRLQRGESGLTIGGEPFDLHPASGDTSNLLHALLDSGLGKHVGEFDSALIDVVATLFDYIFDDPRVPALMKGLIGRLQIPLLKLALLEREFFSNRHHPARRLVNTLAQAAADWEGTLSADASLYRIAESLVERIQSEFSDDAGLFSACLAELDAFLAETERSADARTADLATQLENRERFEIASAVAKDAVAAHVNDGGLPESVRQFLAGAWLQVLTNAALTGGQDGALWQCAATTMQDLVWSVAPKHGAEERRRLVRIIPALLRGLREGLDDAGIDRPIQEEFFSALVRLHAAAVKAGMGAGVSRPAAVAADSPGIAAPLADPAPGVPAADEPDEGERCEFERLKRGCWLNLRDEAGILRRVRLSWISPARTMYLFTNRQGERAMALSRPELAHRFADGSAALAEDRPLLDRIVDDVLVSLQEQE